MVILIHFGQNKTPRNYDTYAHFKLLYIISCNGHDIKESKVSLFSFHVVFTNWPAKSGKQLRIITKASDKQTAAWLQLKGKAKRLFTSRLKIPSFCMKSLQSFFCKVIA